MTDDLNTFQGIKELLNKILMTTTMFDQRLKESGELFNSVAHKVAIQEEQILEASKFDTQAAADISEIEVAVAGLVAKYDSLAMRISELEAKKAL